MSGFESTAPLAVSQVNATTWETTAPLVFHDSTGDPINVPIGTRTDFASVPGVFSWLVPKMLGVPAAVVHDYTWRHLCPHQLAYRDADRVLREALHALDELARQRDDKPGRIGPATRWLIWAAVRWASILTRPGGRDGMWADIPRLVAVTVPGLLLAAPAVVLLPPLALLAAANRLTRNRKDT